VTERKGEVLVEKVLKKLAHSQVGPAAVDKQKAFQVAELSHREVARQHGLHALLTTDPHPNMRRCQSQQCAVNSGLQSK